jgi:anaerobic ribonucleoside-triphosphate reductase
MKVIKRNGTEVDFDINKIKVAVEKANSSVAESERMDEGQIYSIAANVQHASSMVPRALGIEEIQDMVQKEIMAAGGYSVANAYISYREKRAMVRATSETDDKIMAMIACSNEDVKQDNANKNPTLLPTQRDYMAGIVSKHLTDKYLLPQDVREAHNEGIIHFHDADYEIQHMTNCCLVNLDDMLQNGTVISGTKIQKPHSFKTACNIATQIIAQVASSQYGGQTITLSHLAPFVDVSRKNIQKEVDAELDGIDVPQKKKAEIVNRRLDEEINAGCQTIQYQLITLMTSNGQTPFISVCMYIDEVPEGRIRDDLVLVIKEMLRQRIKGIQNEKGIWITPAFPKLLYVLSEDNMNLNSPYFDVTKLAAECTAKRMAPDYISEKIMRELKGDVYPCMGCRSFLTPDRTHDLGNIANAENYDPNAHKYYGRFNQGVVTINLVDVACSSEKNMHKFWEIFDERLELCHRALQIRHKHLLGTPSDVAPILWQYGALARLKKGEPIDKLLYGGYSTISLGYAGLCECTKYMTGMTHSDINNPAGKTFAIAVMQKMNDKCAEWKKAEDIDYSVYGTPLESTTYKFAKCLQKRFGIIPGVTDKNYITNSYHIHVTEKIDAFSKLTFESQFQKLSPGGAISYVEVPNMVNNLDAVIAIMRHIYNTITYAELNTKSDYCQVCGYDGEIKIIDDGTGKLIWECPNCHNRDQSKMNVARRTCGYIGTQFWNQGRTQEIKERYVHMSIGVNPEFNK